MAWMRLAALVVFSAAISTAVFHGLALPAFLGAYCIALLLILPYLALISCKALWHFPRNFLLALWPSYYIKHDFLRQRHMRASLRQLAGNMVLLGTLLFMVVLGRLLPDLTPYLAFSDLEAQFIHSFPADLELYLRNGTLETRSRNAEDADLRLQLPEAFFDISGDVFSEVWTSGDMLGVKDLFLFLPLFRALLPVSAKWDPYVRVTEFSVGDRVEVHVNHQLIECGAPRRLLPTPVKHFWLPAVVEAVEPSRKMVDFRYSVLFDVGGRYNDQQSGNTPAAADGSSESPAGTFSQAKQLTCMVPASSLRRAAHAVFVHPSRTLDDADLKAEQALLVFEQTRFAILEGYSHIHKQHWQYVNVRNQSANSSSTPDNSSNAENPSTPENSSAAENLSTVENLSVFENFSTAENYSSAEKSSSADNASIAENSNSDENSSFAANSSNAESPITPDNSSIAEISCTPDKFSTADNTSADNSSIAANSCSADKLSAADNSSAAATSDDVSESTESVGNDTDGSCSSADASDDTDFEAHASSADAADSSREIMDFAPATPRAHLWHSYDLSELHSYAPLFYAVSVFCKSAESAGEDIFCARAVGEAYFAEFHADWPGLTILMRHNLHLPVFFASLWVLIVVATVFCRIGALCAIYTPVAFVACGLMRHVETPLVPISTVFGVVLHSGLLLIVMRRVSYVVWDGWAEEGHLNPAIQAFFQFDKRHQFLIVICWAIWTAYLVIRMREHNNQQAWQERIDAQRAGMASMASPPSRTQATSSVEQGASEPVAACANPAPDETLNATDCVAGGDVTQRPPADATDSGGTGTDEEEPALDLLDDSMPTCRICYDGASAGRLISPCLCSGSMMFVHIDCLTKWRLGSANPQSFYQCDQCHYRYSFKRTTYAKILRSAFVLHIVTAVAFLSTVVVCSHCLQLLEGMFHAGSLVEPPLTSDVLFRQLANESEQEEEALREQMEQLENFSLLGIKFSHLLRGLMVVGIGGSFWMGFCWFPPGSASSITVLIIVIGAIRVMVGLYRFFKTSSRWLLQSMENMVLEVGPGADAVAAALAQRSEAAAAAASSTPGEPDEPAATLRAESTDNAGASSNVGTTSSIQNTSNPDDAVHDVSGVNAEDGAEDSLS